MDITTFLSHTPGLKKYVQNIFSYHSPIPFFSIPLLGTYQHYGNLLNVQSFDVYVETFDSHLVLLNSHEQLQAWMQSSGDGERKIALAETRLFNGGDSGLKEFAAIELFAHDNAYSLKLFNNRKMNSATMIENLLEFTDKPTHLYFNTTVRDKILDLGLEKAVLESICMAFAFEDYEVLKSQVRLNPPWEGHHDYQIIPMEQASIKLSLDNILQNQLKKFIFYQCLGLKGDALLHYRQFIRFHHIFETINADDGLGTLIHFTKPFESPILKEAANNLFVQSLMNNEHLFLEESVELRQAYYQLLLYCIDFNEHHLGFAIASHGLGDKINEPIDYQKVKRVFFQKILELNTFRASPISFN